MAENHRVNLTWALVPEEAPPEMLAAMCEASLSTDVLLDDTRFACERALWSTAIAWVKKHLQVEATNVLQQARRYQYLRESDAQRIFSGGLAAGRPHTGSVLDGLTLDVEIDKAIAGHGPEAEAQVDWEFMPALEELRSIRSAGDLGDGLVLVPTVSLNEILKVFDRIPSPPKPTVF